MKKTRPTKGEMRTCRVAYLHNDNHLTIWHEKNHKDAGKIEWVTLYENPGIDVNLPENTRLIINPEALPFVLHATYIRGTAATMEAGSDNTKKLGIRVENITIRNGVGNYGWHISNFPGVISSDISLNAHDSEELFEDIAESFRWGDVHIKKVYRAEA